MDAGPGTFAELQRHTDPARLTAIWISHLHADHSADLLVRRLRVRLRRADPARPDPGVRAARLRPAAGRLPRPGGRTVPRAEFLDFRPLFDGHTVRHWNLRLTSRAVAHDTEAYGLRAECQGSVLAYSGDSGPCDALTELASGADLFLCEADLDRHREGEQSSRCISRPRTPARPPARRGVRELYITHVGPDADPGGGDRARRRRLRGPHPYGAARARPSPSDPTWVPCAPATPASFARSIDETPGPLLPSTRRTSYVIYETRYARSESGYARSERRA